jgi:hypothetical protein
MNWISFVKEIQAEGNLSYKSALKEASPYGDRDNVVVAYKVLD